MNKKSRKTSTWKTLAGLGALLITFGGKLKFLIPLLKFGKVGGTIWSMGLMIGTYALIYPWSFSIGIALMLLIHEMGHVFAAKIRGLPVSAPAFIPFLGALIMMKKLPADAETEAFVGYGGPLLGSLGAALTLVAAFMTGYEPLYAIAQIGFFLNLINLLPIYPLDGGRIVTAISRWLWVVGLVGGLIVIIYLKSFLFLIIWALFAWELYKGFVKKKPVDPFITETREVKVNRRDFEEAGIVVPAEEHQRDLLFVQYCRIEDKQQLCTVGYPGIGHIGDIQFEKGLIDKVHLYRTKWQDEEGSMLLHIIYEPYPEYRTTTLREDTYYQVSPGTRFIYGVAYFGLAAALAVLMYITNISAPQPPLAG